MSVNPRQETAAEVEGLWPTRPRKDILASRFLLGTAMHHPAGSHQTRDGSAAVVGGLAARSGLRLALAFSLAACGTVRTQATNVGTEVVEALREKEPELFEIERQLADSAGNFIGRAIEDKVLTRASGVWDTMLLKMNEQSTVIMSRIAQGVERDLNRSLQVMLSENLELTNRQGALLLDTVFANARSNLGPLLDEAMIKLELGMRDRLRPVLIQVIGEAADSVSRRIKSLDRELAESDTVSTVSRLLWGLVAGLGIVVIGGGLAWRRATVRTRQAFRVAMASTPPIQRDAAQAQLRNQGFDRQADWLR